MIYFLIEKGAAVNIPNLKGEIPLHKAAKYGAIYFEENQIVISEFIAENFL